MAVEVAEIPVRPSGWTVAAACAGWFGAVTFAVTGWGGMPCPSDAFWIYAVGMLGAILVGGWLGRGDGYRAGYEAGVRDERRGR